MAGDLEISQSLLDAIRSCSLARVATHCGSRFSVSPLAIYAECPHCGQRLKLRSYAGVPEIEDAIDAVLEWLNDPTARAAALARQAELANDD